MSYNIEKLNIQFYTNVEGVDGISFSRSMLTNPQISTLEKLEEYPYFTYDVDFSQLILSLTYLEQIKFLFSEDQFRRRIKTIPTDKYYGAKKTAFLNKNEVEIVNSNVSKNMMAVLTILFPTYYPTEMNISSSVDIINNIVGYTFSFQDLIPFFLKSVVLTNQRNSVLDIKGKKYTLSKTVWINDIFNHSKYSELPKKYNELNKYRANESTNMEQEIGTKTGKFLKDFSKDGQFAISDDTKKFFKDKGSENNSKDIQNLAANNNTKNFSQISNEISIFLKSLEDEEINFGSLNKMETSYKVVETLVSEDINRVFRELFRQKNDIETLTIIKNTYINPKKFNLNYTNENEKIKSLLTSKYKKFTSFADEIKKFVSPQECTNGALQKLLEDVYSNPTTETNEKFIKLMQLYTDNNSNNDPHIQVGIVKNESDAQKYNIELSLELIGGEVDTDKSYDIDCAYKNENLGNMLDRLVKPSPFFWDVKYKPFYFDSDDATSQKEQPVQTTSQTVQTTTQPVQTTTQPVQATSQPIQATTQTGGNKTRRFKEKMLKSRKKRFRL